MSSPWQQFLSEIYKACAELGCPLGAREEPWFRGQHHIDWQLLPSLFRALPNPNENWEPVFQLESDLFFEFSARASEAHQRGLGDWDTLFCMQHYGTPTRLLDWTELLGVAVYFAIHDLPDASEYQPGVTILNPYALNGISWKEEEADLGDLVLPIYLGIDKDDENEELHDYGYFLANSRPFAWEQPVAIYPRQMTSRVRAQQGWFTIHGEEYSPLEEQCPGVVRKVPLPREALPDAEAFLQTAGINTYLLFPELDGLSKHLKEKYRISGQGQRVSSYTPAPTPPVREMSRSLPEQRGRRRRGGS
jgi:hypothetical protein